MDRSNTPSSVRLLDCTFGAGGELISWKFGKNSIHAMLPLLQKSNIDIIEYGMLCSYTMGPDCTVFDSTVLPACFAKQTGQMYSIILDKHTRPLLSVIPEKSENTADLVRVLITPEGADAQLEYCSALAEKGYAIAALIEETGQYSAQKLRTLLQRVDALQLWGCYIYDVSGVLDANRLKEVFSIYDRVLSAGIRIGFHGRDNKLCVMELAQMFAQFQTEHSLCVDVSSSGMGTGALHLASEPYSCWMNQTLGTEYDLQILACQAVQTKQYLESKMGVGAKLLYNAAALQNCSYRYAEFLGDMGIEPAVDLDILSEISREAAFRFEKAEAHNAIMRYRKNKLNLVIVVLTANHPYLVENLLHVAAIDLLKYGVDIVVYDDSTDERTYAVARNYQLDGYSHVHYKRYTGGGTYNDKVICACSEHLSYDYIWLLRDDLVPTISAFYYDLLSFTESSMDFIVVDSSFRNQSRCHMKCYDNCLDLFTENSARLSIIGTNIISNSLMKRILDHQPSSCGEGDFWMPAALLREIAAGDARLGLIVSDVFNYNGESFAQSFLNEHILDTWAQDWYLTVMDLPEVYEDAKRSAVRIDMAEVQPFRMMSMLYLRASGCFSLSVYQRWKPRLSKVSNKAGWKFCFAALTPKFLAKELARIAGCQDSSWMGKIANGLRRIVQLGE